MAEINGTNPLSAGTVKKQRQRLEKAATQTEMKGEIRPVCVKSSSRRGRSRGLRCPGLYGIMY